MSDDGSETSIVDYIKAELAKILGADQGTLTQKQLKISMIGSNLMVPLFKGLMKL